MYVCQNPVATYAWSTSLTYMRCMAGTWIVVVNWEVISCPQLLPKALRSSPSCFSRSVLHALSVYVNHGTGFHPDGRRTSHDLGTLHYYSFKSLFNHFYLICITHRFYRAWLNGDSILFFYQIKQEVCATTMLSDTMIHIVRNIRGLVWLWVSSPPDLAMLKNLILLINQLSMCIYFSNCESPVQLGNCCIRFHSIENDLISC